MKKRQKIRRGILFVSFCLFPAVFFYQSPVLILEASSKGIVNGSFILFVLLFVASLLFGRAFCGWVCPAAGCQEAIFPARNKKVTKGYFFKWIIWVPWICAITFFAIRSGGYRKVVFFYQTKYGLSISNIESFIAYLIVLLVLIVLPAFVAGKRSFCHHLCWMAPFMILGRNVRNSLHLSSLQLKVKPDLCSHCQACSRKCPMSLPVEDMVNQNKMEHMECVLCGTCVDVCKHGVISYDWDKP